MPETKTKGIAQKLSQILGEIGKISKQGFNANQKYKFVREADVAEALGVLLSKHNLFLHQSVISHEREEMYRTSSGSIMTLTTVAVSYTWEDGDTGEVSEPRIFFGTGADTGDKGLYKALTGAEKYFLMKTFLVATGDDPEADESVDKAVAASAAASGPRISKASSDSPIKRGGKSDRATTVQIQEIAKLAAANGLDAESIVPVIERALGVKIGGQVDRQYLGSLDSASIGKIILALTTGAIDDDKPTDPESGEEVVQEGLTLV